MNFKPVHDYILVKKEEEKEETRGGIIIPDVAKKPSDRAVVVATGPGTYANGIFNPVSVKVDDVVLYDKFAGGRNISLDDGDYLLLNDQNILGIFIPKEDEFVDNIAKQFDGGKLVKEMNKRLNK